MLNIELAEKVATRLWDYFEPSIKSGNQVYFCFSRDLLRSLLGNILLNDPVEEFFTLASQFYIVSGDSCDIEDQTYEIRAAGRSLAILLVAQQILVVEDMVNEGGISEEAYFPRLRRRISKSLSESFALPMAPDEFLNLWNTFRSEVIATGAHPTAITFYAGIGRNKHRSYPLTQALLSSHDLQELADKFPREINIGKISDDAVLELTKKCRLGSRARKVIRVAWLRHRILGQIRSFFANRKNSDVQKVQSIIEKEKGLDFRIYSDEIFEKSFELRASDDGGEDIGNDSIIVNAIKSKLEKTVAMVFTLNPSTKDFWRVSSSDHSITVGDELIFLTLGPNLSKLKAVISTYWPASLISLDEIELVTGVLSFAFRVPCLPLRPCCVRNGSITERSNRGELAWSGGILLDERSNLFLVNYPPSSLMIDGIEVDSNLVITANGRKITIAEFLEELKYISQDHFFNLFVNGRSLQLHLASTRANYEKRHYGFQFNGRNFSVVAEEIFPDTAALMGFLTQNLKIERLKISKSDAVEILSMGFTDWVALSELEVSTLLDSIESTGLPTAVKKVSINLIKQKRSCPRSIKERFEAVA